MTGRSVLSNTVTGTLTREHHDQQTLDIRDLESGVSGLSSTKQDKLRKISSFDSDHLADKSDRDTLLIFVGHEETDLVIDPTSDDNFELQIKNSGSNNLTVKSVLGKIDSSSELLIKPGFSATVVSLKTSWTISSLYKPGLHELAKIISQWDSDGYLDKLTSSTTRVRTNDEITDETLNRSLVAMESKFDLLVTLLRSLASL